MSNGTFGIKKYLTSAGVFADNVDIIEDSRIKLVITDAGSSNEVVLYGRITGQDSWDEIGVVTGSDTKDFLVTLYDFVKLECRVYETTSTRVSVVGSGFVLSEGLQKITVGSEELIAVSELNLTSSDSSINLDLQAPGTVDLKVNNTGSFKLEIIQLSATDILNKQVTLTTTPVNPDAVIVIPQGGIPQFPNVDFGVVGNVLSWDSLGLDGFLEENEYLYIQF